VAQSAIVDFNTSVGCHRQISETIEISRAVVPLPLTLVGAKL
jgi:hypothetical protein